MSGVNIGTKTTRTNIRDACVYGGFQNDDKLYFRDTGIYIYSDSDGSLTIKSDGAIKLDSDIAIQFIAPSVSVYHASITVGAKSTASIVNVAVQLTEGDAATACAEAIMFWLYLSSDSVGQALATAPSTLAVGTDGTILAEHTANLLCQCVTEADGDFDINITDTATRASFVNVVLPSGQVIHSTALSWA
jgi:hypothetical protein